MSTVPQGNRSPLIPRIEAAGVRDAGTPPGPKLLLTRAHGDKHQRSLGFPVGVALIASYLESQGVFVRILDLAVVQNWKAALKEEMDKYAYEVVGVSFLITQAASAFQIARYLKQNYPGTKIVAGGSFPSSAPEECLKGSDFDVACYGEGELTALDLMRAWGQGRRLDTVEGIAFRREDGQVVKTPPRPLIDDLGRMPLPAYHLMDLEPYISAERVGNFTGQFHRSMELSTSRGCPYLCIFCHPIFGKRFRGRSPESVMNDILLLHDKYQVREFVVWDDTFTMDVERAKAICDLIIGSGLKIHLQLRGGVRVERMDEELMSKLKMAGAETMAVGVESAVDRIQKLIKKNLSIRKVDDFLDLAEKYRITTIGLMMLGFPSETVAEAKESIRWACASRLHYTFFSLVTPYPGTALYDLAVREGYYAKNEDYAEMNVMVPHMETPEIPSKKLKWLQIQGYLRFYLRPRRLRYLLSSSFTARDFISGLADYAATAAGYFRKGRPQALNNRS
jgi:anaerobic magnesium-protoporphyrin IX monomethyl ester cyclase